MNRSRGVFAVLAFALASCGLPGPTPSSPAHSSLDPSPTDGVASGSTSIGLSEQEAIEVASELRANLGTEFESAIAGAYGDVGPDDTGDVISPDRQVWAVTFVGEVDVGCAYPDCPVTGTETVFIDSRTGEFLLSQTQAPRD